MSDRPTEFRPIKFCEVCPVMDQFDAGAAKVVLECLTVERTMPGPPIIKLLGVVVTKAGEHSKVFGLGPHAVKLRDSLEEQIEKKEEQIFQQIADCHSGPLVDDGQELCLATGYVVTDRKDENAMIALAQYNDQQRLD